MSLASAISDASVPATALDGRGLMPLDQARAEVAAAAEVTRDNLDLIWLALLSLEDGGELARAAAHLRWLMPPRGKDNRAMIERYGAGALPWLASRQEHGVLVNHPWCVLPCLRALDDAGALELLLTVDGVQPDSGSMTAWVFERAPVAEERATLEAHALTEVLAWARRHPTLAYPVLAARASTVARAADALRVLARRSPSEVGEALTAAGHAALIGELGLATELDVDTIVAELAAASARSWPVFNAYVDGRLEYFGQRVIAARARRGDGWALVFERLQGSSPDQLMLARYAYGPGAVNGFDLDHYVDLPFALEGREDDDDDDDAEEAPVFAGSVARGPAGALRVDESLFARYDLMPGWCTEPGSWAARAVAIRAYREAYPEAWWPPASDALAATGLDDAEVLIVSDAYQHPSRWPDDDERPWPDDVAASSAIRTLVEALVARDPSRFVPGPSNLDWRLHAVYPSGMAAPWTEYQFAVGGRWVAAALRTAAVTADARGLMPLDEARAVLATATTLARGDGRAMGEAWVWDGDRAWAALLSLDDATEAAASLARITDGDGPRDRARNAALVERYGDGAAALVRARARPDGVIAGTELGRATVMALGTAAGFALVWDVTGWDEPGADGTPDAQAGALFAAWVAAHPAVGFVELGRLVAAGDGAAASFLTTWAAPQVRRVHRWLTDGLGRAEADAIYARVGLSATLAPGHITAALDHAAARGGDAWPTFTTGVGPSREYHGLRLIGARVGDGWAVVLERYEGYGRSLRVARYLYGDDVAEGLAPATRAVTPADDAGRVEDERLIEPPDYWTRIDRAPAQVARARAVLAATPAAVWAPAAEVLAAVGLADAEVIVDATAFAHVAQQPSASATYASLAAALVERDPARFAPGESNLAPALHVRAEDDAAAEA